MYADVYSDTGGFPVPNDVTDGCYFNYCDTALGTREDGNLKRAIDLYLKENLPWLIQFKQKYNPRDWFKFPQSIPV